MGGMPAEEAPTDDRRIPLMSTSTAMGACIALEDNPRPGGWAHRAACRDTSTQLFFAADDVSVAAARRLCRSCPVRPECADYALSLPELTGIWGGMTAAERRRLRRALASSEPTSGVGSPSRRVG
jgi:WhiB family redox-sensing transcriptional regulator